MKRILLLLVVAVISISANAQFGAMRFVGPSTFGVAALNAWQDNENDVVIFQMTSFTEADITMPEMNYTAMGVTIPSFTIHGLKFESDAETRNAVFADQTYTSSVTVDGEEKAITGSSFVAEYNHSAKTFVIETTFSYGKMPFPVTFKINAVYEASDGIDDVVRSYKTPIFDLQGRCITAPKTGQIYIQNGRKYIAM